MNKILSRFKKLSLFNFAFLLLAGITNAFGVTIFIAPVQLYDSGISGTSILLSQVTPASFSLSFFLLVLNIPLFMADQTDRLIGLALEQKSRSK